MLEHLRQTFFAVVFLPSHSSLWISFSVCSISDLLVTEFFLALRLSAPSSAAILVHAGADRDRPSAGGRSGLAAKCRETVADAQRTGSWPT